MGQKAEQAVEAKELAGDTTWASATNTQVQPVTADPHVHQEQRQAHQQEAQGRVRRGRSRASLLQEPVAALDPKAMTVLPVDALGRSAHTQADVQTPDRFAATVPAGIDTGCSNRHGEGVLLATMEGKRGPMTGMPYTQRLGTTALALQRSGNDRLLSVLAQEAQHRNRAEAFVSVEAADAHPTLRNQGKQPLDDADQAIAGLHEHQRQGEAGIVEHHIGRGTAIEVSGTGASFAAADPVVRVVAVALAVEGLIMQVEGKLARALAQPGAGRRPGAVSLHRAGAAGQAGGDAVHSRSPVGRGHVLHRAPQQRE